MSSLTVQGCSVSSSSGSPKASLAQEPHKEHQLGLPANFSIGKSSKALNPIEVG